MSDSTIEAYDSFSKEFSDYFSGIGSRVRDIERGISLLSKPSKEVRALEVGCGDGRDGFEISKRVLFYEGFDPSVGLLSLAKERDSSISFVIGDALSYIYPKDLDIVFAFASLLHVKKEDLKVVFKKINKSLSEGGVLYISLKERQDYISDVDDSKWGKRTFYYYSVDNIKSIMGGLFSVVYEDHQKIGSTDWFTLALKK